MRLPHGDITPDAWHFVGVSKCSTSCLANQDLRTQLSSCAGTVPHMKITQSHMPQRSPGERARYPLLSRREMLRQSAQVAAWLSVAANCAPLLASPEKRRFKIGACDWSIGKQCQPEAFELAKNIGLDGVQVSLGTVANDMHL